MSLEAHVESNKGGLTSVEFRHPESEAAEARDSDGQRVLTSGSEESATYMPIGASIVPLCFSATRKKLSITWICPSVSRASNPPDLHQADLHGEHQASREHDFKEQPADDRHGRPEASRVILASCSRARGCVS